MSELWFICWAVCLAAGIATTVTERAGSPPLGLMLCALSAIFPLFF